MIVKMNRRGANRAKRTTESKTSGTSSRGSRATTRREGDPAAHQPPLAHTASGNNISHGKKGEENYGSLRTRKDAVSGGKGDDPGSSAEGVPTAVTGDETAVVSSQSNNSSSMPAATVSRPKVGVANSSRGSAPAAGTGGLTSSLTAVREEKQPVHDVCKLPKKRKFDPSELEDMNEGPRPLLVLREQPAAMVTATTTISSCLVVPASTPLRSSSVSTSVTSPMMSGATPAAPDAVVKPIVSATIVNLSESKPQDLRVNTVVGCRGSENGSDNQCSSGKEGGSSGQDKSISSEPPVHSQPVNMKTTSHTVVSHAITAHSVVASQVLTVQRNSLSQSNSQVKLTTATQAASIPHTATVATHIGLIPQHQTTLVTI
ncbi:hypothetical protein OTU49_001643, partial [Cherax quadricarinatus]